MSLVPALRRRVSPVRAVWNTWSSVIARKDRSATKCADLAQLCTAGRLVRASARSGVRSTSNSRVPLGAPDGGTCTIDDASGMHAGQARADVKPGTYVWL
jgi:hypothetical protein